MEGSGTMMQGIISNAGSLIEFGSTMLDKVIEHPVLGLFFAAGFIGVGIGAVRKLIGLAKRN